MQDQPKTLFVHNELHLSVFDYPPSSQNSSGEITFESPHIVEHVEITPIDPEHDHPFSGPEQSNLHFLLSSVVIPSSHTSSPARIPSLH